MAEPTVAEALEREHREIDDGIAAFVAGLAAGQRRTEPLRAAIAALRRHIYVEEEYLFPPLRSVGMIAPVFVMLREHGQVWDTMDELEQALADGAADPVLSRLCHQLAVQLQHHNLKEERILYPEADVVLAAEPDQQVGTAITSGELPSGWVCDRAGHSDARSSAGSRPAR
jgi:hemerythrin-like domain-containing protein